MRAALAAAAMAGMALSGFAQETPAAGPVIQVEYTNPSLSPSHWTMTLHPDGSGHFHSEMGTVRARGIEAPSVDRDIAVSAEYAGHVFAVARQHHYFAVKCDSGMGHKVAFQGSKRLSYSGPDGAGACEFNYSKDQKIDALAESLAAVATTVVEGARLQSLLVHDRLGLDAEMEYLVEAARDGQVQQLETIRGVLEQIAHDDQVMDRVRSRAMQLLAQPQN